MKKKGSFFVLMFHGIVTEKPPYFLYRPSENCFVREADFESIVRYCKKKYRFLEPADLDAYFSGTADEDGVLITFDDGLQSLFTLGLPILQKYDAKATVFITPGWTNKEEEPAVFALEYHLYRQLPALVKVISGSFLFEKEVKSKDDMPGLIGELWDQLFKEKVAPLALQYNEVYIDQASLESYQKPNDPCDWKPVSWDYLKKTCRDGVITIGAHGQTHTPFTWLGAGELEKESEQSKQQLFDQLGIEVVSCSFPHGLYSEETLAVTGTRFTYGFANAVVKGELNKSNITRYNVPYQRPNHISTLVDYPFIGKLLRKFGHITKLY